MLKSQKGFTLIELVMVIVILGILAVVAIPRYIDLSTNARVASVNGMLATVNGAAAITNAAAIINSQMGATGTVTASGATINTVYGFPRSSTGGIDSAIANMSGFTFLSSSPTSTFTLNDAPTPASCAVVYTQAPSGGIYTAASVTTGCS